MIMFQSIFNFFHLFDMYDVFSHKIAFEPVTFVMPHVIRGYFWREARVDPLVLRVYLITYAYCTTSEIFYKAFGINVVLGGSNIFGGYLEYLDHFYRPSSFWDAPAPVLTKCLSFKWCYHLAPRYCALYNLYSGYKANPYELEEYLLTKMFQMLFFWLAYQIIKINVTTFIEIISWLANSR